MVRKIWEGVVDAKPISQSCTVMVKVCSLEQHPKYGKYIKTVKIYKAHDDLSCSVGDKVEIVEVPRISKTKSKLVVRKLS